MSHKNKNHIILDLDHTLYNYDIAHNLAMEQVISFLKEKSNLSKEIVLKAFNTSRKRTHLDLLNTASSHNRLLYFQKTFESLEMNSIDNTLPCYELYWGTFLDNMTLFEGVSELFDKLKSQNRKICILTDLTAHIQFRKINKLGLENHIDFIVSSEEAGKEKPHPIMFYKALDKLKCTKEESVMIGDNWDKDILGAYNFGIEGIWINHKNENKELPLGAIAVSNFKEIINIL
ncbi:HAD family hydrolase [Flavivirga eckloniae]|uniref:Hydrolase n=1 Tax=Flavivirga eckloniae TaxID=1803846 RepID=A0A2K9PS32_9FLAO|nr:HAD family hydrolase [Flavivirga eckloniae]AUP79387.1 hydrolase [Flavivirga eckloniae]